MNKLLFVIDWICIWSGKIFSVLSLSAAFVIGYEVIKRYGFNTATQWATEFTIMSCGLVYVMGGAWTMFSGQHVKIGLIYDKLSKKNKAIIDSITFLFFLIYIGFLLWASINFSWDSLKIHETSASPWDPPVYPIKIALSVGIFLILLQGIANWIRNLQLINNCHKTSTDEDSELTSESAPFPHDGGEVD